MNSLENLIHHLQDDERVKAFQKLESVLVNHPHYQVRYQAFLETQKALVQSQFYPSAKQKTLEHTYQTQLKTLKEDPLIHQYLTLQSEVNELISSITTTIEIALNTPFTIK